MDQRTKLADDAEIISRKPHGANLSRGIGQPLERRAQPAIFGGIGEFGADLVVQSPNQPASSRGVAIEEEDKLLRHLYPNSDQPDAVFRKVRDNAISRLRAGIKPYFCSAPHRVALRPSSFLKHRHSFAANEIKVPPRVSLSA
jgi:hypothetical protein